MSAGVGGCLVQVAEPRPCEEGSEKGWGLARHGELVPEKGGEVTHMGEQPDTRSWSSSGMRKVFGQGVVT